ncbi:MAG: hypothetical protein ROY99_13740 [Ignavibacterium sp.]|jgi:hypothetical protein|nr:hypothetical protein [Ignavibacterium sp.]
MENSLYNIFSAISGFIGTILLAFSVNPVFKSIKGLFKIMEMVNDSNVRNFDQIVLTGMDRHLENFSFKVSKRLVYIGLLFIILGYILQIIPLFINKG